MADATVHVGKDGHVLSFALDCVSRRNAVVDAVLVNDRRKQGGKKRDGTFQFLLAVGEKGPVGAIASARWVLVDLHEHVLANGEIVADGVLCVLCSAWGTMQDKCTAISFFMFSFSMYLRKLQHVSASISDKQYA